MHTSDPHPAKRRFSRRRLWSWVAVILSLSALTLGLVTAILLDRAAPILRGRVIETLSARFDSKVELESVDVSVLRGLNVTGQHLRIYPTDDVVAAGATHPLIEVDRFTFHTSILSLFIRPMHVGSVTVTGSHIYIPAKQYRVQAKTKRKQHARIKILVDHIICNDSELVIGTAKPGATPKLFKLDHIALHDFGADRPWPYDATLINALPRGEIHATGSFGPWNRDNPGDSPVTGDYLFDHVEMNTIRGLGGILTSTGSFSGQLDRIVVDGATDTPAFELDSARHPVPLHTDFHAIVDGTSGDTYLDAVRARLGSSAFTCRGKIVNENGRGHRIDLDVDIPDGQVRDFLQVAVKTQPPILSGRLRMKARLIIPPGQESVSRRIEVRGHFAMHTVHFSNRKVQDKVDMLSVRAQGHPDQANPGAPNVPSQISGSFALARGQLAFPRLDYDLPGANVALAGAYTLDGRQFDFTGTVRTDARLSQMTASWWKSLLLKGVDPFFHKHGAGAEIPVSVSGTNTAPKFGLNFGGRHRR